MTLARLDSIDRPTIREHAEVRLRDAIVEGRLAPGERLVERELCEALGISRPSLREALRGLAGEGLVQIVAHRGPAVAVITREQAAEIFTVREALEGMAARLLAARPDPGAIAQMRQSVRTLQRIAAGRMDRAELVATKALFYDALFGGCGNQTLSQVMRQLLARISLLRRASLSRPGRLAHSIAEITAIVDAIEAGDEAGAEQAARLHVRRACAAALELLDGAADALPSTASRGAG
ncbi:MAG: GntR family transcriptional regulator [Burkholderiaceae bacterium]|nr:GntR family transcriptional regulator [Burkholderiaceae bacterium]